jgi:hypothetical protein
MSKRTRSRTGREAKRRRARHARRVSLAARHTVGIDQVPAPTTPSSRAGKTERIAKIAELLRSGRVTIYRPAPDVWPEEPLTDSELALRYAIESMGIPPKS